MSLPSRIPIVLMAGVCLVALTHPDGRAEVNSETIGGATRGSRITVRDASPVQLVRLGEALEAFVDAGLEVPDLEVRFFTNDETCGTEHGRFFTDEGVRHIHICPTEFDSVYEHELAHAWESVNLTDAQRSEFMQLYGYSSWSSKEVAWRDRGIEGVAFVIQRGVAGMPLPPVPGGDEKSRMQAYELLTGRPAPVMIEWLEGREVSCLNRPTTLSLTVEDGIGRTCPVTVSLGAAVGQRAR